jgi:hypothetical protein
MKTYRGTAIAVGVLYIVGTVAGVLSVVVTGPVVGAFGQPAPDYLARVSANAGRLELGALFVLIMGLSLALVPVLMYPLSRKYNEPLAIGYVVFRGALEPAGYFAWIFTFLYLVTLGRAYTAAGSPAASHYQTLGALLMVGRSWVSGVTEIVFPLGALMLYALLFQTRLIPRWISGWGLVGAAPYIGAGVLLTLGLTGADSTLHSLLVAPIALQEMVMAVWLIAKGFNPSAIAV